MKQQTVAMIGAGSWGTAVAYLLACNGHRVKLWCYAQQEHDAIAQTRENRPYLPGVTLPELITPHREMAEVLEGVDWVFEAIPVKYLRGIVQDIHHIATRDACSFTWVILSKGIEQNTLMLPSQIIDEVCGAQSKKVALVGPSFAHEIARRQPTAVTVAAESCELALALQELLANDFFRPYTSTDLIGAQVGAALKNVLALGVGIADGAGFGDNTKAFLLTRGFHEMVTIAQRCGAKQETLYGLSGIGDLIMTATGAHSRNVKVGQMIGQGKKLEDILRTTGMIPEGANTVQSLHQMAQKFQLKIPVCTGIYQAVFQDKPIATVIAELMQQPLEWESECR